MIIEKCLSNQAAEVKRIINKMWPSKTIEEILNTLQSEEEIIFIAKVGNEIIGFIHGIIKYDYIEGVSKYPALYIEGIFVEKLYRSQNIASLMVDKLIEYGKEKNISEIASECRENNAESYKWHRKNKFDVCATIIHFVKKINPEE